MSHHAVDQPTMEIPAYLRRDPPPVPAVRVVATYPATDGSAPESIEVIWEGTDWWTHLGIPEVIAALAAVTRNRPAP